MKIGNSKNLDPQDKRPLDERPLDKRPLDKRPLDERPLNKRPLSKRPLSERPRNERPVKERTIKRGQSICGRIYLYTQSDKEGPINRCQLREANFFTDKNISGLDLS